MTLVEIEKMIQHIDDMSASDEYAHAKEDELYTEFVKFVAGYPDEKLAEMARAVLQTKKMNFCRWCA